MEGVRSKLPELSRSHQTGSHASGGADAVSKKVLWRTQVAHEGGDISLSTWAGRHASAAHQSHAAGPNSSALRTALQVGGAQALENRCAQQKARKAPADEAAGSLRRAL